jgi:hypothetical protein
LALVTDAIVALTVGARILTADGYAVVTELERHGVRLRFSTGDVRSINYTQIEARTVGDHVQAVHSSLYPWWEQLEVAVRHAALFKQECVRRSPHRLPLRAAELAQPGEPFFPFGTSFGLKPGRAVQGDEQVVSFERSVDREVMRRVTG